MKYTDGSCVKNIQSVYHEQSLSHASFRLGASDVSTKEFVSNKARNSVTELAAHSAEINDGELVTHIQDTDELNSNMECISLNDVNKYFSNLRSKYPRKLVLTHLNINSIRYKFYEFYEIISGNGTDIVGISETKIDASFTSAQFSIPGFKMYRQDGDSKGNGGGLIVYIKDSIPHRQLKGYTGITNCMEHMSFEISFNKCKWNPIYVYKPSVMSVYWMFCRNLLMNLLATPMCAFSSVTSIVICSKRMYCVIYAIFTIWKI